MTEHLQRLNEKTMRTEILRPHQYTKSAVLTRADDTPQVKAFLLCFILLSYYNTVFYICQVFYFAYFTSRILLRVFYFALLKFVLKTTSRHAL